MRRLILVLFVLTAWAGWSSIASAAVVDITYDLPGGLNNTLFVGGLNPTGGTAKLRMDLTSLSGTLNFLISIRTVKWTHSTAASLTMAKDPITNTVAQVGAVVFTAAAPPGFIFLGGSVTVPSLAILADIRAITPGLGAIRTRNGTEVNRKIVPEPTTGPLMGLGLLAIGGLAARRRAGRGSARR